MPNGYRNVSGIAFALIGAALWGFSGACTQYLFAHYDVSPLFITLVRTLGAGTLFLILLFIAQREILFEMLNDSWSLKRLVVFGSCGLFMCQITYIIVIGLTNAGTATVLQSLNIIFTMLATCLIVKRLPLSLELAGLACALVATALIATGGNLGTLSIPLAGLIWGIINALSVTFYVMYPKKLFEKWGSIPVIGIGMLVAGISSMLIWFVASFTQTAVPSLAPLVAIPLMGIDGIVVLALIVVIGTFGAFGLYLHGVSIVGGMKGSLLGAVEPVSASIFAALWLGTPFIWADWVGLVLMIATIFLVTLQKPASG